MKRYLAEDGSDLVVEAMSLNSMWCASALALTEAHITLCHAGLDPSSFAVASSALRTDWERMLVVPIDDLCLARAREIGCAESVRTLDAIHLAAAERIPGQFAFLTFDLRQQIAATGLGFSLISTG